MHNTLTLTDYLQQEKSVIFDQWFNLIMTTYSELTVKLWETNNDPFTNPVRYHFRIAMCGILNALSGGNSVPEMEGIAPLLDEIVRIRAIQDFTPSQATAFIYLLKKAIRESLWTIIKENNLFNELFALESSIDCIAQKIFDIYSECRKKIFDLRIDQIKKQYDRLLLRANIPSPGAMWHLS
ncbi:MAG TPA: RsbRD N-terminal domain-containing protein [Solidesulfovibrio sp.]|nr:RsbRD N-terminal domain-containing protein [Solidesulfovibrio sp.]